MNTQTLKHGHHLPAGDNILPPSLRGRGPFKGGPPPPPPPHPNGGGGEGHFQKWGGKGRPS